jgi:hypothetical protein
MPPLEPDQGEVERAETPAAAEASQEAEVGSTDTTTDSPSPAPSSGQDEGKQAEPKSMAEAIAAAMKAGTEKPLDKIEDADPKDGEKPGEKPADASGETVEGDGSKANDKADPNDDDDDPTEEELASYRPGTQNRIKKLLSQRNTARREAEELRNDAGSFQQIRQFMQHNQLVDQEVAELFELGAHLKSGDPVRLARCMDRVGPLVQQIASAIGRAVPEDLRPQVEQGEMTEEAAKRLARERTARLAAEQRANHASEQVQQREQQQRVQTVQATVQAWEAKTRAVDPDFDKKAVAMRRVAQGIVAERGPAKSAAEAEQYAREAYDEVNAMFRSAAPAPKPTRPTASSAPASRTGVAPAPSSLADAIRIGLEQAARR